MKATALALVAVLLAMFGCVRRPPPAPVLHASPHYVLGDAYQAGGRWYYPAETYALDMTGIAEVASPPAGLTADGELGDAGALTAAMQTIQLPAVVEVTNLENGRQIMVRVNDRGPAAAGRVIALSPRAGLLLAMQHDAPARVRLRVDETLSRAVVEQAGGGPRLAIATAPTASIQTQSLPAPGSAAPAGPAQTLGSDKAEAAGPRVPDRLPEHIRLVAAESGELWLRCGSFGRFNYANQMAARLAGLGGDVLRSGEGRQTSYAVRAGPFRSIAEADAALAEALRRGVIDARITVEPPGE